MDLENRIENFAETGIRLRNFASDTVLSAVVRMAEAENPWFTREHIQFAIKAWCDLLDQRHLTEWLAPYRERIDRSGTPKTIGVVMAGNIPMVGFHDMLCVLLSGNRLKAKLSSQDRQFLPAIRTILASINPAWEEYISFEDGLLSGFDAIIATGSNNTSRYFNYYFAKYPHIIRKNRASVAVLTGNETRDELCGLASDIFLYFGLGCRNVSKLFVPEGYDPGILKEPFNRFNGFFNHNKYRNNYDYYRSVFMVNQVLYYDGGFYLLKEDPSPASPVSVIHYESYSDPASVQAWLEREKEALQCIVTSDRSTGNGVPAGRTQLPGLQDYADDVDTMVFLTEKI